MGTLDWKLAEGRLNSMLSGVRDVDIYFVMNIIAPLKNRFYNGERTVRLYNEIMNIRMNYLKATAARLQNKIQG
ncbi:MAG: hypothetical protein HYR76_11870 [Ignavibacteria bacterium]|nr:hypothetical protein [Ignavibacteria bacterium]